MLISRTRVSRTMHTLVPLYRKITRKAAAQEEIATNYVLASKIHCRDIFLKNFKILKFILLLGEKSG